MDLSRIFLCVRWQWHNHEIFFGSTCAPTGSSHSLVGTIISRERAGTTAATSEEHSNQAESATRTTIIAPNTA